MYALTSAMLAIALSFFGFSLGGWWHLLHWLSLSFLALVLAYAGIVPRIFAKRQDGTIPAWSKILHLPFMFGLWLMWSIVRILSRENAIDQVADDLYIGRRLNEGELWIEFANYIDLTHEFEEASDIRISPGYINLPILDGDVPTADELTQTINALKPGRTFVHCAQGHGRTVVFALGLLARHKKIESYEAGLAMLKAARPGIAINRKQKQFIRQYVANAFA